MTTATALASVALLAVSGAVAQTAVTNLQATFRDGQVFLTWDEPAGLGAKLSVLRSRQPITAQSVGDATVIAHHISPGSARDWWLNPETFGNPLQPDPQTGAKPPIRHEGFLIISGGPRLNPDSGLHVHTVGADETGAFYYAVVPSGAGEQWSAQLAPGHNSLAQPVEQRPEPIVPIWQGEGPAIDPAAGQGKPLHLILHAKTGRGGMDYLVFGDVSLGWREGLPFKFGVRVTDTAVVVSTTDRTWIDRMFPEGKDGCQKLTPAIHSFWYGYNDRIYDPALMPQGTVVNYTERRLLWLLDWVKRTFGTDANRTYSYGSSMGGCGSISFCLRHPEIFAAVRAHVPIVAYGQGPGGNSEVRVVAETGGMEMPTNDGVTVRERLDGTAFVKSHPDDLPFLVITNGRQDASIPWGKNPDFYRALRDGRHGCVVAWDNGSHSTCGKHMPADIKALDNLNAFHRLFALNQSYPAFSNGSQDGNPGNGEPADGDPEGYFGRGLTWDVPIDTAKRYEVAIRWTLDAAALPVKVDVTPRRVRAFKPRPGQTVTARNIDIAAGQTVQEATLTTDRNWPVTFEGFRVNGEEGNRLVLEVGA